MYGLSEEDLQIQARARGVRGRADPVRGSRPSGPAASCPPTSPPRTPSAARELGLHVDEHAARARRRRLHLAAAGAGPGADGPGHQRARLGGGHPAVLAARRGHAGPDRAVRPAGHRAGSGRSATRSPRRARAPTSTRSRRPRAGTATDYLLNGVKWHVTSYNSADFAFFQAKLDGGPHARRARDVPGRPAEPRGPGGPDAGVLAHDQPPPPDRGVRGRARPGGEPGRRRGRRDGLRLRVVQVRAADGRGPLPRRGRSGWSTR